MLRVSLPEYSANLQKPDCEHEQDLSPLLMREVQLPHLPDWQEEDDEIHDDVEDGVQDCADIEIETFPSGFSIP